MNLKNLKMNDSKEKITFWGKKITLKKVANRNLVRILSKPRLASTFGHGDYSDRW
ncbi:hypothetical protein M2135_001669 [Parabacteroides sp. PF5-9]|nr:hypothetical protein [Parabacteroides sp. PF5-9]